MPSKERPAALDEIVRPGLAFRASEAFCKDLKGKFAALAMNAVDYVARGPRHAMKPRDAGMEGVEGVGRRGLSGHDSIGHHDR